MLVRNCKLTPADVDVGGLECHGAARSAQPSAYISRTQGQFLQECSLLRLVSSVHPAVRFYCHGGDDLQPSSLLPPLASCCGSLPQTEPPHLSACAKVHGQQHSTPLQGNSCSAAGRQERWWCFCSCSSFLPPSTHTPPVRRCDCGCQTQLCLSVSRGLGGLVFSCCGCELLQHIAQMASKLSNIGCILHDEHVHKALEVCRICSC